MEDTSLLKEIFFFKDLSLHELIMINTIAERLTFSAGEVIIKEGTACDAVYIIKEGSAKLMIAGSHLNTIGSKEPIGEISFIDKGTRSATITALEDTVLIKIPFDSFEKLMSSEKALANKIYKSIAVTLCRRLREANEVLKLIPEYVKNPLEI
jgi:CRP-like cAMP-binding protein